MARVSQDHLDARRRQILEAARRCFIRDGFHATSMQDILAEADLSAGAVYRYFRSKDDIIVAIATDAVAEVTGAFTAALDADVPPMLDDALGRIFTTIEQLDRTHDLAKIAVQVWSEALRSPPLAARVTESFDGMRRLLTRLVEGYQERGTMDRRVPAAHIARVLAGLLPGFLLQHALFGDVDAAMFREGLRALTRGDISPAATRPGDHAPR